jgi:hypothetical protein
MYKLIDTFNDKIISKHRTVEAAAKTEIKFSRAVKRNNGASSYIPTKCVDPEGEDVDGDEWIRLTNPGY